MMVTPTFTSLPQGISMYRDPIQRPHSNNSFYTLDTLTCHVGMGYVRGALAMDVTNDSV